MGDAAEAEVADIISDYTAAKGPAEKFRDTLEELSVELTKDSEYPLLFIIDELDRCRPDFAVTLIERIKHFLDVPGIVFLFVMNRAQIQEAVKSVYGSGIDAGRYLDKFVHIWLHLPKRTRMPDTYDYQHYCSRLFELHQLDNAEQPKEFLPFIKDCCQAFALSLRDIERLFTLVAIGCTLQPNGFEVFHRITVVLATLRLVRPESYIELRSGTSNPKEIRERIPELSFRVGQQHLLENVRDELMYCFGQDSEVITISVSGTRKAMQKKLASVDMSEPSRQRLIQLLCSHLDMFDTSL